MRLPVILFALLTTVASALPATAQSERAAAVALFDEGRAALQRGDLDVACSKFGESNRLDPAIGTEFNLANCEEQRGRLSTAWVLFRGVAARMKAEDPRLPTANERVKALEGRVPRVIFVGDSGTPVGTRVRVDDLELAAQSFGSPIPVDPGPHRVIVRAPGSPPRSRAFTIDAGETLTVPLSIVDHAAEKSAQARAKADNPVRADDRIMGMKRSTALVTSGAVSIAGLLVGAVAGIVGLDAQSTGNDGCSAKTKTCTQEGYNANQRAKTLAVVSSIGFVVGVLGGGATTYVYLSAPPAASGNEAAIIGVRGRW
jgi:hypothetical protein